MSKEGRKLAIRQFPNLPAEPSVDGNYWQQFKFPVLLKQYAAVTSVEFCPVPPHTFAVSSSTRVQIYSPTSHQVQKTFSKFKDVAYSASFRNDGKLLVAGGEHPLVQVFDLNSRAVLRTMRGHQAAVHVTKFGVENTKLFSCSDDRTVAYWDLTSETPIQLMHGHQDYVRCGAGVGSSANLWVSGSYDHSVILWDTRTAKPALKINHGHPVEAVLPFPSGAILLTAGADSQLKVWDILTGGRMIQSISNHQKTITTLSFNNDCSRLITGSLDQHLKIYDVRDYSVLHSIRYNAPILCSALSPDNTHLVTGLGDGMLSIRRRVVKMEEVSTQKARRRTLRGGTYRYFVRGQNLEPSKEDFVVEREQRKRLTTYDKFLRHFRYKQALDAALETNNTVVIYSLLDELVHRKGLFIALSGRDEISLQPILAYLAAHITDPRYTNLLIDITHALLDIYGPVLGQSPAVDAIFKKLRTKVEQEIDVQRTLVRFMGSLDMLITCSTTSSPVQTL
jgi:U3 small nucleolar RNA-associated protein 15